MSIDNKIIERKPQATNAQAWEDGSSSRLYNGSNSTFLRAYWRWNVPTSLQDIVVLFQDEDSAYNITQGRFKSDKEGKSSWVASKFSFAQPKGSTFAMCPVSDLDDEYLMLYTVDQNKRLQQHGYRMDHSGSASGSIVPEVLRSRRYLTTSHNL